MNSTLAAVPSGAFSYDADDRLALDTYDGNGNTVSSGGIANTYDFENHLIGQGGATIVYDGDGNRVKKTVAGVTTSYLVADVNPTGYAQVVREIISGPGTNQDVRNYAYGLERISQTRNFFNGQNFTQTSFYVYDGHGSVRALTDPSGNVTDTYDYDAFGNLIHATATGIPPGSTTVTATPNEFLFAGEQFDSDLHLYYNRARYLNVTTGRFWTMDPQPELPSDPGTLHRYLYVRANPVNRVDPKGLQDEIEEVAAEGISEELDAVSVPSNGVQLVENIGNEASALEQTATEDVADAESQAAQESTGAGAQQGELVEETISNPRAAQYQAQITGQPGQAYELNGVRFDGVSDTGELLEAKGPGYARLLQQKFAGSVYDKLIAQAGRQVAAAAGRQIVWHFAEQEAADAIGDALIKLGIKVVVTLP